MIITLDKVKSVNPECDVNKPEEKYIQLETLDSHQFWFMGFVNYDKAVKNLREAIAKFRPSGGGAYPPGPSPQGYQSYPQGNAPGSGPPPQGYPTNSNSGSQQSAYPQQTPLYSQGSGGAYPPNQGGSGPYPPQPQGGQYPPY